MIASGGKTLFQSIVGGGQVKHVVAMEQSRRKTLGDLAKMIDGFVESANAALLGIHLPKELLILGTNLFSCKLLMIGEEMSRPVDPPISGLERRPQRGSRRQSTREQVVQLL
jgi:hypothetical protein